MSTNDTIAQFVADAATAHEIIHGDATTTVETDSGPVRSLAKLIADNQTVIDEQTPNFESIANATSENAGSLTDADVLPLSRGAGLLQTTLSAIATFVLSIFTVLFSAGVGAVARTLLAKLLDLPVTPKDFGAVGNGVANDDAALTAWFAALGAGVRGHISAGIYLFTTAKIAPLLNSVAITGDGSEQSVLRYTGVSTTIDLLTVGDGVNTYTGWSLSGFSVDSNTKMTGGWAIRLKRLMAGNNMFDVTANDVTNLWNAVYLDDVNVFKYEKFTLSAQNEALSMSGSATSDEGSDIFLDAGACLNSAVGFHVGGGQGGVYFGNVLAFGNGTNFQVDNALKARKNREIFFSDLCIGDGCVNYNLLIDDILTTDSPIVINGPMASAGLIGTGGVGVNIYVKSWPAGRITIGPGQLYNATSDGIRVDDATCVISIDPARHISFNGGFGINATVFTTNIYNDARYMAGNALGDQSSNVHNPSWQSFTTTVTPASGTITTLGSVSLFYQLIGGVCHFTANISITTNGAGAGSVNFTLPRGAAGFGVAYGKDLKTGKAISGIVAASTMENLQFYDGTYPGSDGCTLVVSGSYQYS